MVSKTSNFSWTVCRLKTGEIVPKRLYLTTVDAAQYPRTAKISNHAESRNHARTFYIYPLFFFHGPSTQFRVMAFPYRASRSHSLDTPLSVGLLWTSDQLVADSLMQQNISNLSRNTRDTRQGSFPVIITASCTSNINRQSKRQTEKYSLMT